MHLVLREVKLLFLVLISILFVSCKNKNSECISCSECVIIKEGGVTHWTHETLKRCRKIDYDQKPVTTRAEFKDTAINKTIKVKNAWFDKDLHYKF